MVNGPKVTGPPFAEREQKMAHCMKFIIGGGPFQADPAAIFPM